MRPSGPQRVEKRSAEHQTTDNLRRFLLSGEVAPGARLTETALADQLGVSRATTRTGMHRLAAEGLLVQIPYTGWQVADLTPEDAWELWTLRGGLEGLAARLVAESMDEAFRAEIGRAMGRLRHAAKIGDFNAVNEHDFDFHRMLVVQANHKRLLAQYLSVEGQVRLYIATSNILIEDDLTAIIGQHEPLVDALLAGDIDRAQQEAWRHNEVEGRKLIELLSRRSGR